MLSRLSHHGEKSVAHGKRGTHPQNEPVQLASCIIGEDLAHGQTSPNPVQARSVQARHCGLLWDGAQK